MDLLYSIVKPLCRLYHLRISRSLLLLATVAVLVTLVLLFQRTALLHGGRRRIESRAFLYVRIEKVATGLSRFCIVSFPKNAELSRKHTILCV
jgi:hypothetical protein